MTVAQRNAAKRMLGKAGQAVTLAHDAAGSYDPAAGSSTPTTTTRDAIGAVFPYAPGLRNQPGSLIGENDQQLLLSTFDADGNVLDPVPYPNDRVTLADGSKHTIEAVQTLAPAGLAIMHDCRIRGAS